MRILHTADWHLGDRLGRIDRTDDLRRQVERIAQYCQEHDVDVLLVAGDIFSELSRPDSLRSSIEHLQSTFESFLLGGGTILAVTGNHDNETFCQTLRLVMTLAAPTDDVVGEVRPAGRLYLTTEPGLLRLRDRDSYDVQFLMMPYPTASRYLQDKDAQRFNSVEEKNKHLQNAYTKTLSEFMQHLQFDATLPTVLMAHIHVQGSTLPNLFRMSEQESIIFDENDLPTDLAYIALGHIHQPQKIRGLSHVRYSSSIERLDLGERNDQKGVVLFELGPKGLIDEPKFLPLPATRIYTVEFHDPEMDLPRLWEEYPDAGRDLVNIDFTYTAGKDNLEVILKTLDDLFPRWYKRNWSESSVLGPTLTVGSSGRTKSFDETVRDYLKQELIHHSDEEREAVQQMAEDIMTKLDTD